MTLPPGLVPDRDASERVLRAVWALSGPARRWVRSDRVLARASGRRVERMWEVLARHDWWRDPAAVEYAALVALARLGPHVIETRGHFGAPDSPPSEPVFNRCRRADRDLELVLAEVTRGA